MKKYIIFPLIAAASVLLTGCGKKNDSDGKKAETTEAVTTAAEATEEHIEDDTYEPLATVRERHIVTAENFEYEVLDRGVVITKYTGKDDNVEIPAEIDGVSVTEIGFYAFEANTKVVSVSLPESITAISEGAFYSCTALQQINLPSGLLSIGEGAFAGCTSIPEITIPAGVQKVQEGAFAYCTGLKTLTVLSNDLKYENWGLESLSELTVYAPEGSVAAEWASAMGKYSVY